MTNYLGLTEDDLVSDAQLAPTPTPAPRRILSRSTSEVAPSVTPRLTVAQPTLIPAEAAPVLIELSRFIRGFTAKQELLGNTFVLAHL